jgi:SSS family solute:Na+ symporter
MTIAAANTLVAADWAVLAAYFILLGGAGWWWSLRASKSEQDYFYASRSMPAWVVAISLIATAQSAATFLGVPGAAYTGSFSYILGSCGYIIGGTIASLLFLRHYHALGVKSPYELIERRAGRSAMLACLGAFVVGKLFGAGARTYIGALPLSLAIFGDASLPHVSWCVGIIMVVAVLFTLFGGVRSVIWTDMLQVGVYMGAALVAIGVLLHAIDMPMSQVVSTLGEAKAKSGTSKLTLFDWGVSSRGVDWSNQFTVLTALTGAMLLCIAVLVTDQDAVQRALSCRSPREAVRSTILGQVLGIPVVLVFLVIGMLLFVYYGEIANQTGQAAPVKDIFQTFIFTEMKPGVRGLMIAGVLAIGPIGINATLNSLASVVSADLLPAPATMSDASKAQRARWMVILIGAALCAVSLFAAWYQQHSGLALIDFALNSMAFCFAPLLAIVVSLMLLRRGNTWSVIAALVCGFGTCVVLQAPVVASIAAALQPAKESGVDALLTWAGTLAFPWHFVIACLHALFVCVLGSPREQTRDGRLG